jgi:hypothetical protein
VVGRFPGRSLARRERNRNLTVPARHRVPVERGFDAGCECVVGQGCISTAARVVNAIDWVCRAPKGLIAVEDIPQAEVIRGLMW